MTIESGPKLPVSNQLSDLELVNLALGGGFVPLLQEIARDGNRYTPATKARLDEVKARKATGTGAGIPTKLAA